MTRLGNVSEARGGARGRVVTGDQADRTLSDARTREEKLTRAFVDLADTLVETFDVDEFLHRLCERTQEVLDVQAVGVLLETRQGELGLSAASSDVAAAVDLFELQAGQGPCYDAYVEARRVMETDLHGGEQRWPAFASKALAAGYSAVFAFPLRLRGECVGAMNLFRREPGEFAPADIDVAQGLANIATIGLLSRRQLTTAETLSAQLQHALDSRVLIEQAKGVLAERADLPPDEAFDRIRRHARANNQKLSETCEAVVDGSLDL